MNYHMKKTSSGVFFIVLEVYFSVVNITSKRKKMLPECISVAFLKSACLLCAVTASEIWGLGQGY